MMNHIQLVIDELVGTKCKDTKIFDKYYDLNLKYRYTNDYERISETEYYSQVIYLERETGVSYYIDVLHDEKAETAEIISAGMFLE